MDSKRPFHLESDLPALLSRRGFFIAGAGMLAAGSILRPTRLSASPWPAIAAPSGAAGAAATRRGIPAPRAWSPLGEVLGRFRGSEHRFSSERNLARLSAGFAALRACLLAGGKDAESLLAANFRGSSWEPGPAAVLRHDELFDIRRMAIKSSEGAQSGMTSGALGSSMAAGSLGATANALRHQNVMLSAADFLQQMRNLLQSFSAITLAELECTAIDEDAAKPGLLHARLVFHLAGPSAKAEATSGQGPAPHPKREVSGEWLMVWMSPGEAQPGSHPGAGAAARIAAWFSLEMTTVEAARDLFTDVTAPAFGSDPTFQSHLLRDTNYWRAVLDSASGIDIFGNCGVSVADVDGDGRDEIYLCQPQGLPNRLYRQTAPGVFEECGVAAGLDLLDSTSMALFADILNRGRQDLIVITESAPLLFLNNGRGRFTLARDAFPPSPGATSLTGAALADYNRDGLLDLYVCAYGYFQGQGSNPLPSPYYDAQNGPPNYLYRNRGDGTFSDATEASGLNHGNSRFSFACAWVDFEDDGWPDLCVVNDFGRNNFYRNRRDGAFEEVSDGIPGYGSGMSVCAADLARTDRPDLYVGNMWAPAGLRVTRDPEFEKLFADVSQPAVRQFAMGNALYQTASTSQGSAKRAPLEQVPGAGGARRGRWAWCSDSLDLENNGQSDLYIANGFLTAPEPGLATVDAFLWEEVVASSPHSAIVSSPYRAAWTAIFQLAHQGHSWNGDERNVLFLNLGGGRFRDVSGVSGIDFPDDGRSFAVFDFDGDGDADLVLHSRTGPQLRLLRNDAASGNQSVAVRLTGSKSNRDAIGARVEIQTPSGQQTRWLTCGSGFLAQHSKELIFGLGKHTSASRLSIRWPSGAVRELENLEAGYRYYFTEGEAQPRRETLGRQPAPVRTNGGKLQAESIPRAFSAAMIDPLPLPPLETLRGLTVPSGRAKSGRKAMRRSVLLWLWNPTNSKPEDLAPLLKVQEQVASRLIILNTVAAVSDRRLTVRDRRYSNSDAHRAPLQPGRRSLPLSVQAPSAAAEPAAATAPRYNNPPWKADARFEQFISLLLSYAFDYRRPPPSPTGLLIDPGSPLDAVVAVSDRRDHYEPATLIERRTSDDPHDPPRLLKIYWGGADPEEILRDAREGVPAGESALPFPGRGVLCSFRRETRALGAALAEAELYNEAEIYLTLAAANDSKDADTLYNLALVRRELGEAASAEAAAKQALAVRPGFAEAENLLGVLLIQSGKLDAAKKLFEHATAGSPEFAEAWNNLGYVMLQTGDLASAANAFNRALEIAPEFPDALNNFGILLARQGKLRQASEEFTRTLALQPANEQAANNLGVVYYHQGKSQEARQTFLKLLEHNPNARSVLLNLVKLDLSLGKKDEARRMLADWLARRPGDSEAKALLAKLR